MSIQINHEIYARYYELSYYYIIISVFKYISDRTPAMTI